MCRASEGRTSAIWSGNCQDEDQAGMRRTEELLKVGLYRPRCAYPGPATGPKHPAVARLGLGRDRVFNRGLRWPVLACDGL